MSVSKGDVFASQWGYDMTIVCYYEVLHVSASGRTVTVRELKRRTAPEQWGGDMHVEPVLAGEDRFKKGSEPFRRRVKEYGGAPYIAVQDSENAYLQDALELIDGLTENTLD
ncbi:hypothetical protein [Bifidobacterium myosotis]|uniref:Uncharacterized protein n=1 Tax=Bifidobacterium myosotis TaxID=1630166 RepID=A0A5M9ZHY0_9BIFI|nr:hypothetical protein [Bifidobacterium myosotis]KAA8827231.1 hypothetical protein EMO91_09275 [Bifidobacterium myosotis]